MLRHQKQISLFFVTILSLGIIIFGVYKIYPYFLGPVVEITYPKQGEVFTEEIIEVRGKVSRVEKLIINGSPLTLGKSGLFETKLAIYEGHNILQVIGYDRRGRSVSVTKNIQMIRK